MRSLLSHHWSSHHSKLGHIAHTIRENEKILLSPDVLKGMRWGLEFAVISMLLLLGLIALIFFTGKLGMTILGMARVLLGAAMSRTRKMMMGGSKTDKRKPEPSQGGISRSMEPSRIQHDSPRHVNQPLPASVISQSSRQMMQELGSPRKQVISLESSSLVKQQPVSSYAMAPSYTSCQLHKADHVVHQVGGAAASTNRATGGAGASASYGTASTLYGGSASSHFGGTMQSSMYGSAYRVDGKNSRHEL